MIIHRLVLAASLALPGIAAAQTTPSTVDAVGTWNTSFTSQQGVVAATLKLQKEGEKLTGTIASDQGETTVEGALKGSVLSVSFNYTSNGQPMAIEMTGTIDDNAAKGTFTANGNPTGDWSASRAKKKDANDLSGAWSVSVQLDSITATPSLLLKQDGTKLSGDYTSQQYGTFPLTGEVTGTAVTFTVPLNVEGNAVTATYSGVLQGDGSIKGTVNFAGMMSGTFSAARKK